MLAKTTTEMIVFFMMILLTWLLLIDMLFNAFFIFHLSLCLFLCRQEQCVNMRDGSIPFQAAFEWHSLVCGHGHGHEHRRGGVLWAVDVSSRCQIQSVITERH